MRQFIQALERSGMRSLKQRPVQMVAAHPISKEARSISVKEETLINTKYNIQHRRNIIIIIGDANT